MQIGPTQSALQVLGTTLSPSKPVRLETPVATDAAPPQPEASVAAQPEPVVEPEQAAATDDGRAAREARPRVDIVV